MLNIEQIGKFLTLLRKENNLTQKEVAEKLNVSFQSISKWETGNSLPNIETLHELSILYNINIDEILTGCHKDNDEYSYSKAGVNISYTDTIKTEMKKYLETKDKRVLNGLGPFASLYDIKFNNIASPVLVLKSEEPGSKQKLATEYGYTESICHDMINHLVNDIVVMGATPLAVLDTIVCGKAEKDTIKSLVKGISEACKENECSLVGGETSIQPSVIENGTYILTSSIAGIVDKDKVIDESKIEEDDIVLAIESNGLHTNGYSLVRLLMDKLPHIKLEKINKLTFIEQIMKPHTPYYKAIKDLFETNYIHGMAHITGGGIEGNLCRVIPDGLTAEIDLNKIKVLDIFKYIHNKSKVNDQEMLSTFNCGVGFNIVVNKKNKDKVINHIKKYYNCYEIGIIKKDKNNKKVEFINNINWI